MSARAERIQRLIDVLRDHGLSEEPGPEVEHTSITRHEDGVTATVTEMTEDGTRTYTTTLVAFETETHEETP